jgi:hypothetical protein
LVPRFDRTRSTASSARLTCDSGQNRGGAEPQPDVTRATARASIEPQAQCEGGTSAKVATPTSVLIELHPPLLQAECVTFFRPGRFQRVLAEAPVPDDGTAPEKLHESDVGASLAVLLNWTSSPGAGIAG